MVYLLGWGVIYFIRLSEFISGYRGRALGFFTLLVFAVIAIFRGATGTDTANYELILTNLSLDTLWNSVEPGFGIVGLFFTEVLGSAQLGVRAIAALFYLLVGYYYYRSDRNEVFVLFSYWAPAFFYAYSMNGLRIGIASVLLLLAVQLLRRGRAFKSGVVILAAVSSHFTILFSVVYIITNHLTNVKWRYLILVSVIGCLILYVIQEYLILKVGLYSDMESPGSLSGYSKVIVVIILAFGVIFSSLSLVSKTRVVFMTILFTGAAVKLTSYSYAGLRFLDLISFALPIIILMLHNESKLHFNWKIKSFFILAGFIATLFLYRGYLIESGHGKSPFLPYEVIGMNDNYRSRVNVWHSRILG